MMEATEGLSEGPVTSRPASLGLLVVSLTNVNTQLARSQTALADYKERLTSLQTLPVTELVRLAGVSPDGPKLATVVVRRMAQEKVAATIASKSREVALCCASVEALSFLVWRHLEHFLLYSGAAGAGAGTAIQEAYSKHVTYTQDQGYSAPSHRTGFAAVMDDNFWQSEEIKNTLIHNCIGSHTNCFMSLLGQSSVPTNFEKALHKIKSQIILK